MKPKVLIFDIETAPLESYIWSPRTDYVGRAMLKTDRCVLAYAAKWLGSPRMYYDDQRKAKDVRDDKRLLTGLAALIGQADALLTKNGKRFDVKVMNGRMAVNRIRPATNFKELKHIDTEQMVRRHFDLPYYGLDYLADLFKLKHRKLPHKKYPGIEMWRACLGGDRRAWVEMERYNKADVLTTEDLYHYIKPWGSGVDLNAHRKPGKNLCQECGSGNYQYRGVNRKANAVFKRYQCKDCGTWGSEKGAKNNLLRAK